MFGIPERNDAYGVEAAHQFTRAEEVDARRIEREGTLVAMMRSIDMGGRFTVIVEVFPANGGRAAARMRPYSFHDAAAAATFLEEAVSSFALLGCDVKTD
jgi:hypothetical protein